MSWQYRNIYSLIYERGGKRPVFKEDEVSRITTVLEVIENCYHDRAIQSQHARPSGVYKKRSLGSAKMILDQTLKMLGYDFLYRLPKLKNQKAYDKVHVFFNNFFNYYIAKKFRKTDPTQKV
jgi:hypothetical protein